MADANMPPAEAPQNMRASRAEVGYADVKLDENELELLSRMDRTKSGKVNLKEVIKLAQEEKHVKKEASGLRRLVVLFSGLIVVLVAGVFCSSYAAVELAKEMKASDDGKILTSSGNTAKMSSSDFSIKDGKMLVGDGTCAGGACRRLAEGTTLPVDTLATTLSRQQMMLSSSLPDSAFDSLSEVTVLSDRGHKLNIQVHGYSRKPVLNSRCGNIVTFYTAWGGRVMLDDMQLSFDEQTAEHFDESGFSIVVGGVGGRRLTGETSTKGFFNHIETLAQEGSWKCTDVPLPKLPTTFTRKETSYLPCVDGLAGRMSPCQSRYGGLVPGVAPLEAKHLLATAGKANYYRLLAGHEVDLREKLFVRTQSLAMQSESWDLQVDSLSGHPGQQKVYLYNRKTKAGTTFQHIVGGNATHLSERPFCKSVAPAENPQAKYAEIEEDPSKDTDMHFEFVDIVREGGIYLRHFRVLPSEVLMEWSGAKPASEQPEGTEYEFWDNAETLAPYRLLLPDGAMVLFDSVQEGTSDDDVEAFLGEWGLTATEAVACPADTPDGKDEEAPEILSPSLDTTRKDLAWYEMWLEEAGLTGFSQHAAFESYADRAEETWALPDICLQACHEQATQLKLAQANGVNDNEDDDQAAPEEPADAGECGPLIDFVNCLSIQEEPLCGSSHFVTLHEEDVLECQSSTGRRLQAPGIREALPFQPQTPKEEAPVEYSTVLPGSHLAQLKDGSRSLDLSALSGSDREGLAAILKMPNLDGAKLIFNQTKQGSSPSSGILQTAAAEGAVHEERRLEIFSQCAEKYKNKFRWHYIPRSCATCREACIHWGCDCKKSGKGPFCWPGCQKTHPRVSAALSIKLGKNGPTSGHVTVTASGSMDIAKFFNIPPPLAGDVTLAGSITMSSKKPCNRVSFSFSGFVSLTFAVSVDLFGKWTFRIAALSLSAGGGVTSYKYNCRKETYGHTRRRRRWNRRRTRTVCDSACDISIWAKAEVTVSIAVAGVKGWAKLEYYFRAKDFDITVGVDGFVNYIFGKKWSSLVSKKIM